MKTRFQRATFVRRGSDQVKFFRCVCGELAPGGTYLAAQLALGHTIRRTCTSCGSIFSIRGDYIITPISIVETKGTRE
jgi:hypothetical protein